MTNATAQKLFKDYPALFENQYNTFCPPGWYHLVDQLCSMIQWEIDENGCPPVQIGQIKEKFGELRFYFSGGNEKVQTYASFVENLSTRVCDQCGAPGQLRSGSWIRTLCDTHAEGRKPFKWAKLKDIECDQFGPVCNCGFDNIAANAPTSGGYHAESCNVTVANKLTGKDA